MGLIKAAQATRAVAEAAVFSLRDFEEEGRRIVEAARHLAERLTAEAGREAERLRAAGYQQGLEQGRAEGLEQGRAEGAEAAAGQALEEHREQLGLAAGALSTAAAAVAQARPLLSAAGLREAIELAAAIARRVTKRQGTVDPAVLTANLAEAVRLAERSVQVRVAIHPAQRQTLDAALPRLKLAWPEVAGVEVIDDDGLAPGGCRVYTAQGMVDADLDSQLDRVIDELLPADARADGRDGRQGGET